MDGNPDKPKVEKKTELDLQREELKAEEEKLRGTLVDAIFAWGEARRRQGYHEGYAAGRDAAKETFIAFLKEEAAKAEAKKSPEALAPPSSAPARRTFDEMMQVARMADLKPKEVVLAAIKTTPGLRGTELLQKIRSEGIDLHERTFRTQLYRLKVPAGQRPREGNIVAYQNRWYAWPDVPEGYQHVLITEDADRPPDPK